MQKLSLTIRRGDTVDLPIRVESGVLSYAAISTISRSSPVSIGATAHGIPDGWRAAVMNAVNLVELNAENNPPLDHEFRDITRVDANTVEINEINAAGFRRAHAADTGQLAFYLPVDLSLYVGARMECKDKVGGTRLALFATADTVTDPTDGDLELDTVLTTLWLHLTEAQSIALSFKSCVFDIELIRANGDTRGICAADSELTVLPEITTAE